MSRPKGELYANHRDCAGAKLFGSEDLYADQYLFVNGYPKRILANGGTPVGILSSDGYAAEDSLSLCDAFVFCGGARFYPYHFQVMEYAAKSGKPVARASASGCR